MPSPPAARSARSPGPTPRPTRPLLALLLTAGAILPALAAPPPSVDRFYLAYGDRPGEVISASHWETLTPFLRPAAVPFVPRTRFEPPVVAPLPQAPPYTIDRALSAADQATLREIAEGLRLSPTGRLLYGFLGATFAPGTGRTLTLKLDSLGTNGDRAATGGTPPHYVITLNKDLIGAFGAQAMVPKLGHEIIHIRDYSQGISRSVAIEVSAHAADAAIAYESNQTAVGKPFGPYSALISLRGVYELRYLPFRRRPSAAAHAAYWRDLMTLVLYERAYRNAYTDAGGETVWNSPPGIASAATYVPYDPAYGWPEAR